MSQAAAQRFDRYEVLKRLGEGGMGEVWKARARGPHGFEKTVALKRTRPIWTDDPSMMERFILEARIAAQLQHPNIVQVFDFGRYDDELFIVMEYVDGVSLHELLATREGGPLPVALGLTIALDVARALERAHRAKSEDWSGLVHQDVSPGNILLSRDGSAKLTDFGVATWAGPTSDGMVGGKRPYMAPEQLQGESLDGRVDVFALGVVLHEMLTGHRPWRRGAPIALEVTLESTDYCAPSDSVPSVPAELDALVMDMLRLDREDRISSATVVERILRMSYSQHIVLDPSLVRDAVIEVVGRESLPPPQPPEREPDAHVADVLVAVNPDGEGSTVLVRPKRTPTPERAPPSRVTAPVRGTSSRRRWVWASAALIGVGTLLAIVLLPGPSPEESLASTDEPATDRHPTPATVAPETASKDTAATSDTEMNLGEQGAEATPPPPAPAGPTAVAAAPVEAVHKRAPRKPHSAPPAAPAPATAEPATQDPATVNLYTHPWAEIWLDGRKLKQSAPVRGLSIPAGTHELRLVNPVVGRSAQQTLTLAPGERRQIRMELAAPTAP